MKALWRDTLEKPSATSVHFCCSEEFDLLVSSGLQLYVATLVEDVSSQALFGIVAEVLRFPACFGSNWDALDDCLTDLEWLAPVGIVLALRDANRACVENSLALRRFLASWSEANEFWLEANRPFHLLFVCK